MEIKKVLLMAVGLALCVLAGLLSFITFVTAYWMLLDYDVLDAMGASKQGEIRYCFGLFQLCIAQELPTLTSIECGTMSDQAQEALGKSNLHAARGLAIVGLILYIAGVGCIGFSIYQVDEAPDSKPPSKIFPYLSAAVIALGATLTLISTIIYGAAIYPDFKQKVDSGTFAATYIAGQVRNENLRFGWSFILFIVGVCFGVASAIVTAVGAKKLPNTNSSAVAPDSSAPGVVHNTNPAFYTDDQITSYSQTSPNKP